MDISTIVFLSGITATTAYVSYFAFCDVYALITNAFEDFASKSF